jgi:hypothetical protein
VTTGVADKGPLHVNVGTPDALIDPMLAANTPLAIGNTNAVNLHTELTRPNLRNIACLFMAKD